MKQSRYPLNGLVVVENLKMLDETPDNFVVFTSTTINMLTYEHWADLMLWIDDNVLKKINEDAYVLVQHMYIIQVFEHWHNG